jgi:hypothetical protein
VEVVVMMWVLIYHPTLLASSNPWWTRALILRIPILRRNHSNHRQSLRSQEQQTPLTTLFVRSDADSNLVHLC